MMIRFVNIEGVEHAQLEDSNELCQNQGKYNFQNTQTIKN